MHLQILERKRRLYLASFILSLWGSTYFQLISGELEKLSALFFIGMGFLLGAWLKKALILPVLGGMILSSLLLHFEEGMIVMAVITITVILVELVSFIIWLLEGEEQKS